MLGGSAAPLLADPHPELRGSDASLDRQNRIAREHDFTYLRSRGEVRDFASQGYLVRIQPTAHLKLLGVSFPYARPEVDVFLRRLASQYRSSCGEPLVVTSLTRPTSHQPANASDRSVHPTGMAIDLRYSRRASCRRWLENVLVTLEGAGVLEATRERFPTHYHVAVFPRQYTAYVDGLESATLVASAPDRRETGRYRVRSGDSLWDVARAHGTTVSALRAANELRGSRIRAGQTLVVPVAVAAAPKPEAPAQVAAAESTSSSESRVKPRVVTASVLPSVSDVVAALAAPAPTEEKPSTYQVRSGDSLWDIAREHGTTVQNLRQANRLRGNRIQVGQVLHMEASSAAATRRRTYRVRSGDSLWDIARAHGTTVRELRRVNDLPGNRIFVGQVLEVPRLSGPRVRSSAGSAQQP
jgi:LysM repeat protein